MTAKHPGTSPAKRRVLDAIGCGDYSPMMSKATRDALLKEGLIEQLADKTLYGDLGLLHIAQFQMTIAAHIAWCEHQSETTEEPT